MPNLVACYRDEHDLPDVAAAHYGDGGLAAVLLQERTGVPFSFTAHSLGAHKLDKLSVTEGLIDLDAHFHFTERIEAERLSMSHSAVNITSTAQGRAEQHGHRLYRGVVDPADATPFSVVAPGVALEVFDAGARAPAEDAVRRHVDERIAAAVGRGRASMPVIVASSRLDAKKNFVGLITAYAASAPLQRTATW